MKLRNLNRKMRAIIAPIFIAGIITACNSNDKSEKISGSDTSVSNSTMNDSNTHNTSPAANTSVKKKGKVTATMMTTDANAKIEVDKMGYYSRTEVAPVYPGGQSSLEDYINNNIEYPQEAIDNNTEGTVQVQFSIDENGKVSNAKALGTSLGYGLDEAAVKVVSQMPKWTPGMVKGKKVKAWYTLPITYKLEL
jgi:TonB family protein